MLLRNDGRDANGTIRFSDVAMATGADDIKDGRGMASADFDNDGDLDFVINNSSGDSGRPEMARATLLRNNVGERHNWLAVELKGSMSNRDGVGALVTIETGGEKQVQLVSAGSGFASQHSARLYFGLAEKTKVDAVNVKWPNGRVERFERVDGKSIESRRLLRVTEGGSVDMLALAAKQLVGPAAR